MTNPLGWILSLALLFGVLGTVDSSCSWAQESKQDPPVPADKDKLNELTFDDLKFKMEVDETFDRKMLTKEINGYHGTRVRLRGYIQPNYKQTGLTRFIFVRDNQECCFGPKAAIYDNVLVRLARDTKTDYTVRPVTVEGKFALKEYKGPDGKVWSLYRMYDAEVK